ncbi:MAG: GAF domain-containing sensor histidine kinase [Ferruginibacter sp.]
MESIDHLNIQEALKKSQRFYKFIGKVNDLVLHAKDVDYIYENVCSLAIDFGEFKFAWIGVPDVETQKVKPIFWSGYEAGYLDMIKKISTQDIPEGRGPSGKAIREGKYYYSNDIEHDPAMVIWREEALKRGYLSSIALPIIVEDKVVSILTIYADRPDFFNEEELLLLVRITENISYALNAIVINEKRKINETQIQKLSQAVLQSSASIVITNLEGNIEFVNPAFCKLTGYTFEEAYGQNPRILKSGYTDDDAYKVMWNEITNFTEWKGEFCNKKKNGDLYWEFASISPIVNEDGRITHFVAVKENITDRKKAEQALKETNLVLKQKTEELIYTNKELEKFAFVASHDLQEPLRMVSSFLQLFERKYTHLVDEEARNYIHFATDGASRMKKMISDLLEYSRTSTGVLTYEEVNVEEVLKDILQLFKFDLELIGADVIIHPLPIVRAGKSAMAQLLQNLLSNAIKYRSQEKLQIIFSGEQLDKEWVIHVQDNGIGIDPIFKDKIFQIFQRLHNKDEYSGTGIGLSVCKKIVERYNGKIWVDAALGKGATFSFSIPITAK